MDTNLAGATLRIDLAALAANWRTLAGEATPAEAAGVVKADAYGLGAAQVAPALWRAGCRHFFVAHLSEALSLTGTLPPSASLYVLNGLMPGAEAACAEAGVIPVLNSLDQLDRWAAAARLAGRPLPALLQLDTGMSRLGLPTEEVEALIADPARLDGIDLRFIMSHLACADTPSHPANLAQREVFSRLSKAFPGAGLSLDNSAGTLTGYASHFNLVRPGIALYGGAARSDEPALRPVVSLETRIVQLRRVLAGTGVGYGLTFTAERETTLATLPVGYADGWPRHLSNCGSVYIGGARAPIAGRVSMDSMTVDVTDIPAHHLYPGAPVELIGPNQTIDAIAADAGTISYEILTQLSSRYDRVYLPFDETTSTEEIS